MTRKFPLEYLAVFSVILIFSFLYLLGNSQSFQLSPSIYTNAIIIDLFCTLPLVYFLLIRKTKIPNFTTLYVFLLALGFSNFILPYGDQSLLQRIKFFAIPAIELGIFSMVAYKMWRLRKSFKGKQKEGLDFYDNLLAATREIFPMRLASIMTTEISVLYYLFKIGKTENQGLESYSYDKKSGIKMVMGVILFLVVIETFAMHLLVAHWNTTVAWVLTFLSIYAGFQILSILRSMSLRPILINPITKTVSLRYGIAAQTVIPIQAIDQVERTRKSSKENGHILLTPFDMLDTHNLTLHLKEEFILNKIYGMQKMFTSISLFVDDYEKFALSIEDLMENNLSD